MIWHSNPLDAVLNELQVDPSKGLSNEVAERRLKEYGENRLHLQKSLPWLKRLSQQLKRPSVILLLILSAIAFLYALYTILIQQQPADWLEPLLLVGIVLANALLGSILERRADTTMRTINKQTIHTTRVLRDGEIVTLSTHLLALGDIVMLETGNLVPADCRLIEADHLRCDESRLIEESLPTAKTADAIFDDITPLAMRTNMIYSGTAITSGTATAVVVATGARSEMGRTAQPSMNPRQTSIQKQGRRLNLIWHIVVIALCVLLFILGLIIRDNPLMVALTATALLVATIPQGITARLTQLTTHRISELKRHLDIHQSEAVSTLGRVNVLCLEQDMLCCNEGTTLCNAFVGHRMVSFNEEAKVPSLSQLMRLAALNTTDGDSMDAAILNRLAEMGIDKTNLLLDMPRIGELPATASRKTAVHLAGEQSLVLVTGEWRSLLPLCVKGNVEELTNAATAMEKVGLQVLAVTFRLDEAAPAVYVAEELEQNLTCAGLLGIRLPLQEKAPKTRSRMRTLLFSEDSVAIASAVARNAGIIAEPCAVTGEEIEALTDGELAEGVRRYNVYCSLSAQQKLRVLNTLKKQGRVLAVTASRTEDAELLSVADVGIARGAVATDVVKDAADLILTEDRYATIMEDISEGRRLRLEKVLLVCYFVYCTNILFLLGLIALVGWMPLSYCGVLLLGLHLLFMELPTPFWVVQGISKLIKKLF